MLLLNLRHTTNNGHALRLARFGPFEADLHAGELWRNGRRIRVQRQPFEALAALLEHAGDVVSREDLRGRIWPAGTFVDFDHSLNTAINKLRHTLCDSVSSPRFVETVPQRGYRFIAPVERLTASRRKFLHPPASAEIGRLRRQRLLLALALLAVLTLCVVAWSNSPASVL